MRSSKRSMIAEGGPGITEDSKAGIMGGKEIKRCQKY